MSAFGTGEGNFDWCSFYALFWNDKGVNLKLDVPDTVLLRNGHLSAWWGTDRKGHIKRHQPQRTTWEAIRLKFLQTALEDDSNHFRYVAIVRQVGQPPRLLKRKEFNELAETMSDLTEGGGPLGPTTAYKEEPPFAIQVYQPPYLDLRYVATYVSDGSEVSFTVFPCKFSKRYRYIRNAEDEEEGGPKEPDPATVKEIDPKSVTIDTRLKTHMRSVCTSIIKYIEHTHNLTLSGLVCEFTRDNRGRVFLLSVLKTEWATTGFVHHAIVAGKNILTEDGLTEQDEDTSTFLTEASINQMTSHDPALKAKSALSPLTDIPEQQSYRSFSPDMRPMSASVGRAPPSALRSPGARPGSASSSLLPRPGSAVPSAGGTYSGPSAQLPRADHSTVLAPGFSSVSLQNSWPSAVHHDTSGVRPRSARPPGKIPARSGTAATGVTSSSRPTSAVPRMEADQRAALGKTATGPKGVPPPFAPGEEMHEAIGDAAMPPASAMSRPGRPVLQSQLSRELESTRDELYFQTQLAEASARKVGTLEQEREQLVSSFNSRIKTLDGTMAACKSKLDEAEGMLQDRELALMETRKRAEDMESERNQMQEDITNAREDIMTVIKRYHDKESRLAAMMGEYEQRRALLTGLVEQEQEAIQAMQIQVIEYQKIVERERALVPTTPYTVMHDTVESVNLEENYEEFLEEVSTVPEGADLDLEPKQKGKGKGKGKKGKKAEPQTPGAEPA